MNNFLTKNLKIRASSRDDLEYFYKWELMPEVTEFFSIGDNQTMKEVVSKFETDLADDSAEQFTITLRDSEEPIGRIVLADIIKGWKGEIWRIYIADKKHRGKGYGYEAMHAIIKHCFDDLNFQRLYLDHYTGNPVSKLYLSLGFKYEGILRKNCQKNGKLYDVHLMSMLRDEYEDLFLKNNV